MHPGLFPAILLSLLALICLLFAVIGLRSAMFRAAWSKERRDKALLTAVFIIFSWLILLAVLSSIGFFADFSALPPRPALVILFPLPFVLWLSFSKPGNELLKAIPAQWLVYFQSFRILVEIFLLLAFLRNLLPVQMTFEGRNFDILTGILALPVGYFCFVKRKWNKSIVLIWNMLGLGLLINILIIAVLSMPVPFRYFMNEPANTIVARFPFIYLPGVLVVLAYSFHIFSLRKYFIHK